ncbi:MAG TPA: S26 family signal peptidase [Stellaceae bacterium]|nr:S26 family signal peptidase [Stellaceae bacterium]
MTIAVASIGLVSLGASAFTHPVPRLIWNASASAPLGLYRVELGAAVGVGDLVLAALPDAARQLAAVRGYLPANVPAVKRIAAAAGDVVCADSGIVVIDNRVAADILLIDGEGRPLPAWHGCRALREGEIFLLNEGARASFDGRYFGPIESSAVFGKLVPLWTR